MSKLLSFLFVPAMLFITGQILADTPDFIRECMDCHGEKGVSKHSDVPTIAGNSATFIEEIFAAYRYDMRNVVKSKYRYGDTSRAPTSMKAIAKRLSNEQISKAAKYFSELPFVAAKQKFDPTLAVVGEKIHLKQCEKCHQNGGKSPEKDAAILSGQWIPYLRNAIKHILDESRDVDLKMIKKVNKLTDDEWEALLNFYGSRQGD